jgi:signal transduction histidine kinase
MIYGGQEGQVVQLIDVPRTVKEMLELLKLSLSKHAILETRMHGDLPPVRANAAHIRQIVMNLVTNASEAIGDRDGVVRVSTRHVTIDKTTAAVQGVAEGDYVQLEVADNGCGMTPETQARVFDPFFTTKAAGRGLGLGVVQGIVRDLHGTVEVVANRA